MFVIFDRSSKLFTNASGQLPCSIPKDFEVFSGNDNAFLFACREY